MSKTICFIDASIQIRTALPSCVQSRKIVCEKEKDSGNASSVQRKHLVL